MKNSLIVTLLAALAIGGVAVSAQAQGEPEDIARVYFVDVKMGSGPQFEEALKAHMAYRRQHNDPWAWQVFSVVNGDTIGQYVIRSGNHRWADLDAYETDGPDPGAAHFLSTMGPYIESVRSIITQATSAVSRLPADLSGYEFFSVTEYDVRAPGQFIQAVTRIHEAIGETNWPVSYGWATVANGGPARSILVIPARNWAGFAPPEQTIVQMLTEAYGAEEAMSILGQVASSSRIVTSSTVQLRPGLSLQGQ